MVVVLGAQHSEAGLLRVAFAHRVDASVGVGKAGTRRTSSSGVVVGTEVRGRGEAACWRTGKLAGGAGVASYNSGSSEDAVKM